MARHGISLPGSPIILAIENSTMCGSVALVSPGLCIGELSITSAVTHSRRLIDSIHTLMDNAALDMNAIDAVAVSIGPGSFTGVRIGVTTAKGLAIATQKPLIGVNSLDALASQVGVSKSLICAMLDARKNEVFAALYKSHNGTLERCSAQFSVSINTLCQGIAEPVLFIGDGAQLYHQEIQEELNDLCAFAPQELCFPRASAIGMKAISLWQTNSFSDPATLSPDYIRPSDAEICYKGK